ncbi:MAG TPA: non-homologous end-joining DNA ligase [Acidimicrobiales bacterium]|nr:non-homologous end-joining DNA ligase [Acidimicrobiales bacterium]
MPQPQRVDVKVGERSLSLSNLDKVLWPETGFTKGQLIDYYSRIATVMVPHLTRRPITLRRWPNGVAGQSFFEKNCPSHKPPWVKSVPMGDVNYCLIDEPAALVWVANLAAIEIHPSLAQTSDLEVPTAVVFDLDPGAPADIITCAQVAFILREALDRLGLKAWPKTSGSKGIQVYAPLNSGAGYDRVKPFAQAIAQLLERDHPDLIVSVMEKSRRKKKVFIDWSQNTASKTTVAVYSVRALDRPSVSTPVTWDELDSALSAGDGSLLRFGPEEVLERIDRHGDLHSPVVEVRQELPV